MSDTKSLACIILAAGQGKRMKSSLPKALHCIAGRPAIGWLLESVAALDPEKIIIVASPEGRDAVSKAAAHCETVIQEQARGTGDAVRAALPALEGFSGDVLILMGDMPLISTTTLRALIDERYKDSKTGLAVLGAEFSPPPAFGRLVLTNDGAVEKIIEDKDCSAAERNIKLCNTGAFCVDGMELPQWIAQLDDKNAQQEFYITDLPAIAARDGVKTHVHVTHNHDEVQGVNSRADLAVLEHAVQKKLRMMAMENGATLIDPDSVYFSWDTQLGRDVVIEPQVFFGPGVRAFSHLEGAIIGENAAIGPFARIRPQSEIGDHVTVGNFIEVNRTYMKAGSKAKHVSYLGDASIGEKANIGAGTVIANYDGFAKHNTTIGAGAFIGTNSTLVAPLSVGEGALVAAGSTITKDVPADALAVAREKAIIRDGWAAARRNKKKAS